MFISSACSRYLSENVLLTPPFQYLIIRNIYNKSSTSMESILLQQFTKGMRQIGLMRYTKIFGHKTPRVLDTVIPDLTQNLKKSTQTFVQSLAALDAEFIESVSSKPLQKVLLTEIKKLKDSEVGVKIIDWKLQESTQNLVKSLQKNEDGSKIMMQTLLISPYVIFGQTMEDRNNSQDPWANCVPLCSNRYIYKDPKGLSLRTIMSQQIFGFNCFYTSHLEGYQISQGLKTSEHKPREHLVTFETDSQKHQFFATDYNSLVRYP